MLLFSPVHEKMNNSTVKVQEAYSINCFRPLKMPEF